MIVKCSHCKAILSSEDFDTHDCDLPFEGVKTIEVAYFMDVSCKNTQMITGRGTDGILYTFEVVPRKPIPIVLCHQTTVNMNPKTDEKLPEPLRPLYKGGYSFPEH